MAFVYWFIVCAMPVWVGDCACVCFWLEGLFEDSLQFKLIAAIFVYGCIIPFPINMQLQKESKNKQWPFNLNGNGQKCCEKAKILSS